MASSPKSFAGKLSLYCRKHKDEREMFGTWGFISLLSRSDQSCCPEWLYRSQVAPSRSGCVELGWEQMTSSPDNAYIIMLSWLCGVGLGANDKLPPQCIHYNAFLSQERCWNLMCNQTAIWCNLIVICKAVIWCGSDRFLKKMTHLCFPGGSKGEEPACQCRRCKRCGFGPWVGKIPWRWAWQSNPVFLPGQSHGWRRLVGYSPWGCKELDTTEVTLHVHMHTWFNTCNI